MNISTFNADSVCGQCMRTVYADSVFGRRKKVSGLKHVVKYTEKGIMKHKRKHCVKIGKPKFLNIRVQETK